MYKPLPKKLTIKESPIHGFGIYAKDNIPEGELLGIIHIPDNRFENGAIRTPLGGYVNHSDTPNCSKLKRDGFTWIATNREIKNGEELTVKYTLYNINGDSNCK